MAQRDEVVTDPLVVTCSLCDWTHGYTYLGDVAQDVAHLQEHKNQGALGSVRVEGDLALCYGWHQGWKAWEQEHGATG